MNAFRHSTKFGGLVLAGKQAIKGEHRQLLIESKSARVASSLNFEYAMADLDLDCKRFDYFVESSAAPDRCHALEVHAFNSSELQDKKRGTVKLLARHCPSAIAEIASWQVLVKGTMPRSDLAARFQADCKIRLAGRSLDIEKL